MQARVPSKWRWATQATHDTPMEVTSMYYYTEYLSKNDFRE